jgi:hypothetical protein
MAKKTKTISKLKKDLDTIFSIYIRLRESNEFGYVSCFTCPTVRHYKDGMQNGHFMSRKHLATRFSEDGNCEVQCLSCNIYGAGMQYMFGLMLENKYGEGRAEELRVLSRTTLKISSAEYVEKISYYKNLVENLKEEKGIA